jgi:hypothetical protein
MTPKLRVCETGSSSCFHFFGHLVYDYRLREHSIAFMLFRTLRLWQIPYSNIACIRRIAWREVFSLGGVPFAYLSRPTGQLVLIKRNSGFFKNVLITPDAPEEFVETVLKNLSSQ